MSTPETLPVGKLHSALLKRLLHYRGTPDPRVVQGPAVGEDAAVIDIGDRYLVAKTDPITFVTEDLGWYLVQVNANDLATTGATPRWLLVTLLLPEGAAPALAEAVCSQVDAACRALGIAIVGGHTEVTAGLDRPIAVGHMLGEVHKDRWIHTGGARLGDDLVLVKPIAIEATSILARAFADELRQRGYAAESIARAEAYLYKPGISVVREARIALEAARVHAMHDPTEGGIATAIHELAEAAGLGAVVEASAIPITPESAALCAEFRLDPLGVISSGALLVALDPRDTPGLQAVYDREGIPCAIIGRTTKASEGVMLLSGSGVCDLPRFDQDEIARLF